MENNQQHGKQAPKVASVKSCQRCGATNHSGYQSKFQQTICHYCHKKGHLAKVCRSKKAGSQKSGQQRHHHVVINSLQQQGEANLSESSLPLLHLKEPQHAATKPLTIDVQINGIDITMEVDTGAAVSVMSWTQQLELFPTAQLKKSSLVLRTY